MSMTSVMTARALACGGKDSPTAPQIGSVTLSRDTATLVPNATASLSATVKELHRACPNGARIAVLPQGPLTIPYLA